MTCTPLARRNFIWSMIPLALGSTTDTITPLTSLCAATCSKRRIWPPVEPSLRISSTSTLNSLAASSRPTCTASQNGELVLLMKTKRGRAPAPGSGPLVVEQARVVNTAQAMTIQCLREFIWGLLPFQNRSFMLTRVEIGESPDFKNAIMSNNCFKV